jgi:DNA polymerase-3 subunit beta
MNLVTPREAFLQNLQFAASVCPTRSTRPILMDVVVSVDGDHVQIAATDGDVSVRRRYTADDVKGEGEAAFPASTLLSAVRSIDSETLSFAQKETRHHVSGGRAQFKLHSDDPELFPALPTVDKQRGAELPLGTFLSLCQRTMFAAAKEMGRYAFNGVLLDIDAARVTLVGTDGRRLAMARADVETGMAEKASVVLPLKGLTLLQRAQADDDAVLRIELRESMVAFVLPSTEIQVQLVEGEFPDYGAVIPNDGDLPHAVVINREELAQAIQRAAITAGDEGPAVELGFAPSCLTVCSSQEGVGEVRSEIEIAYEGEAVEIRFNPSFLGEYLKTASEETVTFRFKDRGAAGLFEASDGAVYVVMPITS